jgi:hypothetical protein
MPWGSWGSYRAPITDCRGYQVVAALEQRGIVPSSVVDLCCGYGIVIKAIHEKLPQAKCIGVDVQAFPEWEIYAGIEFRCTPFQLFIKEYPEKVDLVMLFDTWRNWGAFGEGNVETRLDLIAWLKESVKYFICTGDLLELELLPHEQIGWVIEEEIQQKLQLVTL